METRKRTKRQHMKHMVEAKKKKKAAKEKVCSPEPQPGHSTDQPSIPRDVDRNSQLMMNPSEDPLKIEVKEEPFDDHHYTTLPPSSSQQTSGTGHVRDADRNSHLMIKSSEDPLKVDVKEEPFDDHTYNTIPPSSSHQTSGKSHVRTARSEEQDEHLATCVGRYEWLYLASHPDYKDPTLRRDSWAQIAQEVGLHEDDCRKRWQALRDRYVRIRKAKSKPPPSSAGAGQGTSIRWLLYPLLDSFLHASIQHQSDGDNLVSTSQPLDSCDASSSKSSSPPDGVEITISEDDGPRERVHEQASTQPGQQEGGGPHNPTHRKRKRQSEDKFLQDLMVEMKERKALIQQMVDNNNESMHIGRYVAQTLNSIQDPRKRREVTAAVVQCLVDKMLEVDA